MKLLIAGLGSIGRRHLRNLIALGEKDLTLFRTHRSTLPDEDLAGFPVETDLRRALAQKPDAVIVSNPTALHLDVAIPAAEAGCHLFLEKPVSDSLARIGQLERAVQRGGGQVFVGYQFRFHPGLRQVQAWLQSGAIGRPLSARAHWGEFLPGWHPWEDYRRGYSARADLGGGVVLTLCHPLDYLRWLLGGVSELWAFAGRLGDLDLDVEDTAEIGLRFANGALASVHLDYNQRPAEHWLEIIGTEGTVRWQNRDGAARCYSVDRERWEEALPPAGFERNDLFRAQMAHFLRVVAGEEPPVCSLSDGIQALELALAVHRSDAEGRRVSFQGIGTT